jgi:hypothetical protein
MVLGSEIAGDHYWVEYFLSRVDECETIINL